MLLLSAALQGAPALAQNVANASAQMENVQIQVVDLDLADGIAPQILFPNANGMAKVYLSTEPQGAIGEMQLDQGPWDIDHSAEHQISIGSGAAQASAGGIFQGTAAGLATLTINNNLVGYGQSFFQVLVGEILVSPHTRVIVTGFGKTSTQSVGNDNWNAYSRVYMRWQLGTAFPVGDQFGVGPGTDLSMERAMFIQFDNTSNSLANGTLEIFGEAFVAALPETGTAGSLLAGLLVLAAWCWKSRQQRSAAATT